MKLSDLGNRIIAVLYPQRCVLCGSVVAYGDLWCGCCEYERITEERPDFDHRMEGTLSALKYTGNIRKAVIKVKISADKRTVRFLASEMHQVWAAYCRDSEYDFMTPVPVCESVLKARGFNHAGLLADRLGELISLPVHENILSRSEASLAQHGLTQAQRKENAEKSYHIREPEKAFGKSILLIDDVLTTGYTVSACAGQLLASGAKRVFALTATAAAYTGRNTVNK